MNMNEPEIFVDHIVDTPRKRSLSKMRKPELYEYTKDLFKENAKLLKENANLKFLNSVGDNIENVERIEFLEKEYIKLKEDNKLKDEIIYLHEQGLSGDDVEVEELKEKYATVCIDYDKLAEDHEELKEKDKKSKEIFKELGMV